MTIITVKCGAGAYNTNTIRGQRASSTHSAEMAALRLAEKLRTAADKGADLAVQQLLDADLPPGTTRWQVLRGAS